MINKRLVGLLKDSIKYVKLTVVYQWLSLLMNIVFIFCIANIIYLIISDMLVVKEVGMLLIVAIISIGIRFYFQHVGTMTSYKASMGIKKQLRANIYEKVLQLGNRYQEKMSTAQVIQVAMEGVEQLEIYFGKYLPQLFYSLLAPITLFIILCFINFKVAIILFICVPLIPISIVAIQKFAKKLLAKYWGSYTELGDSFLENLQGLTTLKIYQADAKKAKQMDTEAEHFRKVTMRVLVMQLNSISIMDLVAFGGAALGIVVALLEFQHGYLHVVGLIVIILLSSEFFIPLRLLGSFFHIAMNGMAASDKIFKILDMDVKDDREEEIDIHNLDIVCKQMSFSYQEERQILKDINIQIPMQSCIAFVGKSGCGKSTIANIIAGQQRNYEGSIKIGDNELATIKDSSIMENITVVNHDGYLFAKSVAYNLRIAKPKATDTELWNVLETVNLAMFIKENGGLEMEILEQAANLSGGQKQRLILARALLKDTPIYIFDEATSNIDVESENTIMKVIYQLQEKKTIILISHRLENVKGATCIYMMKNGQIIEEGTHLDLYRQDKAYANLYKTQESLMEITRGGVLHD